jgi:hypothetical protein
MAASQPVTQTRFVQRKVRAVPPTTDSVNGLGGHGPAGAARSRLAPCSTVLFLSATVRLHVSFIYSTINTSRIISCEREEPGRRVGSSEVHSSAIGFEIAVTLQTERRVFCPFVGANTSPLWRLSGNRAWSIPPKMTSMSSI